MGKLIFFLPHFYVRFHNLLPPFLHMRIFLSFLMTQFWGFGNIRQPRALEDPKCCLKWASQILHCICTSSYFTLFFITQLLFICKHISHFECPSLCCYLFHSLTVSTHFHFMWYECLSLGSTKNMLNFFYVVTSQNLTQGSRRAKGFLIIYYTSCWNID